MAVTEYDATLAPPRLSESREHAVANARPFALARAVAEILRLGSMVVLARLVSPSEFGAATVALSAYTVAFLLSGEALVNPLVQRKVLRVRDLEAGVALSLLVGLGSAAMAALVGVFVIGPLVDQRVGEFVLMCSPAFLISCLNAVPVALLQRGLRFREIGVTEVVATVAIVAVSIPLGELGAGGSAVVIGTVAGAAVQTALQLRLVWSAVPRPRLHRRELRELTAFGVPSFAAGLGIVGYQNIDYVVLTMKLGTLQVGYYWRAFSLAVDYQQKVGVLLSRFALPLYTRADTLTEKRQLRVRLGRLQATMIYPLLTLLIVLAPVLIPWLFGDQWQRSVTPTQILAGAGMLATFRTLVAPFVLTLGRPRSLVWFNFPAMAFYGLVVVLAAPGGLLAVCWGALGTEVALSAAAWFFMLRRLGGVPLSEIVQELWPPVISSAICCAAALPVTALLRHAQFPSLAVMALVGVVAAAVYLAMVRCVFPVVWRDLAMLRNRR